MKKYLIVIFLAAVTLSVVLIPGLLKEKTGPVVSPHTRADHPMSEDVQVTAPAGGNSIADVYTGKAELAGSVVLVRGKVVKFTPNVMGKNWIHIRDGTGREGTNDLTVTTGAVVKIGDTVTARGLMEVDKDFGYGYKYEILISDAEVIVE